MSAQFRRGLVVGKFSPLHRGHMEFIRRAAQSCETLYLISYSNPEFPGCEPARRERWLAKLFPAVRTLVVMAAHIRQVTGSTLEIPHNDADALEHRRFCGRLCLELLGTAVDAVFTSESYGDGFAAELARFFRERDSSAGTVVHVGIDPDRRAVPISASEIRKDVHRNRQWLDPEIYADFVERVCLLGGESSGKSTLAAALASRLGTNCTTEYGRDLWIARGGRLWFEDMLEIGRTQVALEDAMARKSNRYLICDTSALTTLLYSDDLFGRVDPELDQLAKRPYALQVLCSPDFPFVQDGSRRDDAYRAHQHRRYLDRLRRDGCRWMEASGPTEVRVAAIECTLAHT